MKILFLYEYYFFYLTHHKIEISCYSYIFLLQISCYLIPPLTNSISLIDDILLLVAVVDKQSLHQHQTPPVS